MQKLVLRSCSVALILALAAGAVFFSVPGDSIADRANAVKAFGAQASHVYTEVKSLFDGGSQPPSKTAPVKVGASKSTKSGQAGTAKVQPVKAEATVPPQTAGQVPSRGGTKLGAGEGNAIAWDKVAKALEQAVFRELNRVRREHGLSEFKWNDQVAEMARLKSIEVMETGLMTHNSTKYGYAYKMYQEAGIPFKIAGEVLYATELPAYETKKVAMHIVEGWMKSHAHREAVLTPDFTEAGVGVAWTQEGVTVKDADSGQLYEGGTTCTNALFYAPGEDTTGAYDKSPSIKEILEKVGALPDKVPR